MSEKTQIKVPDIGDFDKVPVIEVLVSEGDEIEIEQSLITLESEKAAMEVPSSHAGRVVKVLVNEGDEVSKGDPIVEIEVGDETEEEDKAKEDKAEEDEAEEDKAEEDEAEDASGEEPSERDSRAGTRDSKEDRGSQEKRNRGKGTKKRATDRDLPAPPVPYEEKDMDPGELPHASPSVRKLARELGVELAGISGSGRKGRITEEDLKSHVKQRLAEPGAAASGLRTAPAPSVDFAKFGEIETQPLSRIKRISGPVLHRNWVSIPHVTQFDEADITDMEAFRKAHDEEAKEQGTRLTPLVFLIKAVVAALREFPHFNASLSADGESIVLKKYFHIGIAVDTGDGLVVPVVRECERKGLMELAHDLTALSGKAREGKLTRDEMQGSCFSISSLGGIGGTAFTPIINAPDLAILGVSRAEMKPVWDGEVFTARLMLPLSLSYDHRVIDGADAARFTRYLAKVLEDLRRLLL